MSVWRKISSNFLKPKVTSPKRQTKGASSPVEENSDSDDSANLMHSFDWENHFIFSKPKSNLPAHECEEIFKSDCSEIEKPLFIFDSEDEQLLSWSTGSEFEYETECLDNWQDLKENEEELVEILKKGIREQQRSLHGDVKKAMVYLTEARSPDLVDIVCEILIYIKNKVLGLSVDEADDHVITSLLHFFKYQTKNETCLQIIVNEICTESQADFIIKLIIQYSPNREFLKCLNFLSIEQWWKYATQGEFSLHATRKVLQNPHIYEYFSQQKNKKDILLRASKSEERLDEILDSSLEESEEIPTTILKLSMAINKDNSSEVSDSSAEELFFENERVTKQKIQPLQHLNFTIEDFFKLHKRCLHYPDLERPIVPSILNQPSKTIGFDDIPADIIIFICANHLDLRSLSRLSRCSRRLHQVTSADPVWASHLVHPQPNIPYKTQFLTSPRARHFITVFKVKQFSAWNLALRAWPDDLFEYNLKEILEIHSKMKNIPLNSFNKVLIPHAVNLGEFFCDFFSYGLDSEHFEVKHRLQLMKELSPIWQKSETCNAWAKHPYTHEFIKKASVFFKIISHNRELQRELEKQWVQTPFILPEVISESLPSFLRCLSEKTVNQFWKKAFEIKPRHKSYLSHFITHSQIHSEAILNKSKRHHHKKTFSGLNLLFVSRDSASSTSSKSSKKEAPSWTYSKEEMLDYLNTIQWGTDNISLIYEYVFYSEDVFVPLLMDQITRRTHNMFWAIQCLALAPLPNLTYQNLLSRLEKETIPNWPKHQEGLPSQPKMIKILRSIIKGNRRSTDTRVSSGIDESKNFSNGD